MFALKYIRCYQDRVTHHVLAVGEDGEQAAEIARRHNLNEAVLLDNAGKPLPHLEVRTICTFDQLKTVGPV